MVAPICDNEDYFSRPNKHQYNNIIGIIGANNGIAIRTFQKQKLRPGLLGRYQTICIEDKTGTGKWYVRNIWGLLK